MIHIETAEKNQRFGFGISGLTSKPAHQMEPRTDMSLSGTHVLNWNPEHQEPCRDKEKRET